MNLANTKKRSACYFYQFFPITHYLFLDFDLIFILSAGLSDVMKAVIRMRSFYGVASDTKFHQMYISDFSVTRKCDFFT